MEVELSTLQSGKKGNYKTMITLLELQSLEDHLCECDRDNLCRICKNLDEQEQGIFRGLGLESLRDWISMRHERDCIALLQELKMKWIMSKKNDLLKLLNEDQELIDFISKYRSCFTPDSPQWLSLVWGWMNEKSGWSEDLPAEEGDYDFTCKQIDPSQSRVQVENRDGILYANFHGIWNPVSYWHHVMTYPRWRKIA